MAVTCISCHGPIEAGRAPTTLRCRPCWAERNRAKARAWYNANPDRAIARTRQWEQTHRQRKLAYWREYGRRQRVPKVCETPTCGRVIEVGQRKFCRSCNEFYQRALWHTFQSKRRAA